MTAFRKPLSDGYSYIFSPESDGKFGAFALIRNTWIDGTDPFYDNLNLESARTISYTEIMIGLSLQDFRIFFNKNVINRSSIQGELDYSIGVLVTPRSK